MPSLFRTGFLDLVAPSRARVRPSLVAASFAALVLAEAACAEAVPLVPPSPASVDVAVLDSARDVGGWRLGVVRSRFTPPFRVGFIDADGSEDEYAFDCAGRSYSYARRTLSLAGVVVDNRVIPSSRWPSSRFPVNEKVSIPAQAFERFCALKDVPAK